MEIISELKSSDGQARKFTFKLNDGNLIETTYVDYVNKHIICYSTQVGCAMGCQFCFVGRIRHFVRNLTADEITQQVDMVIDTVKPSENKPVLFSAMGTGEPLANYKNYMESVMSLHEKYQKARFAMATIGANQDGLIWLQRSTMKLNFKLTVSLHATRDYIRKKIMPNAGYVSTLLNQVCDYQRVLNREVEYNYVLIDGLNDDPMYADELAWLLFQHIAVLDKTTVKINRLNPIPGSRYKQSPRVEEFIARLRANDVKTEYYETNGSDIYGACGQMLAGRIIGG